MQDYQRIQSDPLNFTINSAKTANDPLPDEQRLVFDFRNSWNVAFGIERTLNSRTTVRIGYLFDRSPVPDQSVGPLFPDSNRNSLTVGATRRSGNKDLSIFYEAMWFENRVTNVAANDNIYTNGDYRNFANLFGLSMRFNMSDVAMIRH